MKKRTPPAPPPADPLAAELAVLDAEIARLSTIYDKAKALADVEGAKLAPHYSPGKHTDADNRADAIARKIRGLREVRDKLELDGLPSTAAPAPRAASVPRQARKWQIDPNARAPDLSPGMLRTLDADALKEKWIRFSDGHVADVLRLLEAEGADPDQPATLELLGIAAGHRRATHAWHSSRIEDLEARIAELEKAPVRYRGVYQRSEAYRPGDVVTHHGSAWHCVRAAEPGSGPQEGDGWQLMVKAGRDGKDAR